MTLVYRLAPDVLRRTFNHFRECGRGTHECQILWTSPWDAPQQISDVVHPSHDSGSGGFVLESGWLNRFWRELADAGKGVRVQIHTHPRKAFHSRTDDRFPIIHRPGFLSLVIPNFGLGPVSFDGAYLTEIQADGSWQQVSIESRLVWHEPA